MFANEGAVVVLLFVEADRCSVGLATELPVGSGVLARGNPDAVILYAWWTDVEACVLVHLKSCVVESQGLPSVCLGILSSAFSTAPVLQVGLLLSASTCNVVPDLQTTDPRSSRLVEVNVFGNCLHTAYGHMYHTGCVALIFALRVFMCVAWLRGCGAVGLLLCNDGFLALNYGCHYGCHLSVLCGSVLYGRHAMPKIPFPMSWSGMSICSTCLDLVVVRSDQAVNHLSQFCQ